MSASLVFTPGGVALPLALKRMEENLAVPTLIITPCHGLLPIPLNFAVPGMANPPPSWPTTTEVDSLIALHSVTVYIDLMALRPSPINGFEAKSNATRIQRRFYQSCPC